MTEQEKISYALGAAIGSNYVKTNIKFDGNALAKGFNHVINNENLDISPNEIQMLLQKMQEDIEKQSNTSLDLEKQKGKDFLIENRKKEGVIETASGLQYKIIHQGYGKKPNENSIVEVHYHGTLLDGTVFDSSVLRKKSIEFPLNQVIAGWTEGVQLMNEGSKFEFFIPSHLAYGDQGAGADIKGGATLKFEVELLKVK
ncbi:MAG TPA: FKBP-type peptidyl-prolyl cis-trans isomerase [Bacteroidales bacterium]|jgi:FKBP-type peptidyl-prolyl cis-trans isomerase|nr:FKBP-type peptidyl-prolyl cis-trans isomerase [Bacteroidales bacterium]HOS15913.1 FKBP-type peptidyl-prolyl cis-trans isomerase [Bacteroidales bacterium]